MWGVLAGTLTHAILILVLFVWLDAGFKGIMVATGFAFFVRFLCNFSLVMLRNDVRKHDDVYLFSWESCTNVTPLLRKSFASLALGVWGWWSFDIFTLMATYIGTTEAGAQTIMRSIGLLTFMMPVGFASGAGIMIGKSIGQKNTPLAQQYYKVGQMASIAISICQSVVLGGLKDYIIGAFTSDSNI